jgi:hypothetical protein
VTVLGLLAAGEVSRRVYGTIYLHNRRNGGSQVPDKETILRDKTFKEDGMEVGTRAFYTLSDDKAVQVHRTTKAVALLVRAAAREEHHVREGAR